MCEAPGVRDETWRKEFEKQATPKLREKLYRVAYARLRQYAGRARHVEDADADDAVMGVLHDTLDGAITWDPAKLSLLRFLTFAIRYRVRDQVRAQRRRPHDELAEDQSGQTIANETSRAPLVPDIGAVRDLCALADEVVPDVRRAAQGDAQVCHLLDLMMDGVTENREVRRETKWSAMTLRNARRRLRRITDNLPTKTRDAVKEALS